MIQSNRSTRFLTSVPDVSVVIPVQDERSDLILYWHSGCRQKQSNTQIAAFNERMEKLAQVRSLRI